MRHIEVKNGEKKDFKRLTDEKEKLKVKRTRIEKPNQGEGNNENKNKRRTTELGKIKRR